MYCNGVNFDELWAEGYAIGLNEKGVAFIPDFAEPGRSFRTCYTNYIIPFAELTPYLSESGSVAVSRILVSLRKKSE
jgi:hypothetical protein